MDEKVKKIEAELGPIPAELVLAQIAGEHKQVGEGIPYVLVPNGYKVAGLEHLLSSPQRARAEARFEDVTSFVSYVTKHDEQRTIVVANEPALEIEATLDYHSGRGPAFAEHRALLKLASSKEWLTWLSNNKKQMNQATFAQFIEDNLPDIVEPEGAVMLEISRSLQLDKKVNFLSTTRLQDGNREFVYQEQQEASAAKGTLRVPETFKLGLSPFAGAAAYSLTARLRFRLEEGKLILFFDLVRPHKVVEDAFQNVVNELVTGLKTEVLRGSITVPPCRG